MPFCVLAVSQFRHNLSNPPRMSNNKTNQKFLRLKPAQSLLIFFAVVLASFSMFVLWEAYITKHWLIFGIEAPKLEVRDWLFLIAVLSGIAGWVWSSYVTLRNSIKQHTVAIYVQSRLSSPYAEISRRVNLAYFCVGSDTAPIAQEFFTNAENASAMHDIGTILNYFEFIAVGIRHGDLDEEMLRNTMRGMITNMCAKAMTYIHFVRDKKNNLGGDFTYEHLLWLNARWTST